VAELEKDAPAPRRRWGRRRVALLVLGALLIAARVGLPGYLRGVIEEQGTALLSGRVTVGDVDLSLLRGEVVLKDVALAADDATPEEVPLVAFGRFWVNVAWWPLTRKVVVVEDVGLDALDVRVDRLADGSVVLPSLRPVAEAAAEVDEAGSEEEPAADPWGVVIESLAIDRSALQLEDFVTDPPEVRELALPSLRLARFRLQPDPDAGPGRGRIRMRVKDGTLEVRTRVRAVEGGFDVAAALEATDLPLDRLHVHLPELGWTRSTGRLGGLLTGRVSPGKPLVGQGSIELDDIAIDVPDEKGPALAWKRLEVDVDRVDLEARHAAVKRVALDGATVVVRPGAASPLPIVPPPAEPDADAAPPEASDDVPAWTWSVGTVRIDDTLAKIALEPPPLDVMVRSLALKGLSSEPGAEATLDAKIEVADGTLALEGPLTIDPIGATIDVSAENLDVGRLTAASGGTPAPVAARLDADLQVIAREDPLVVTGRAEVRDVETKLDDGDDFLVAWKRLVAVIDEVTVGGVLPVGSGEPVGPVSVKLGSLEVDAPRVVATMADEGIVLPAAPPPEPGSASAPEPEEAVLAPRPADPAPPTSEVKTGEPAVSVRVGHLVVRDGDVRFTDQTVSPAYRGRLASLMIDATDLASPGGWMERLTLRTRVGGKAPIEVDANRNGEVVTVTSNAKGVSLKQFNPYAESFGYHIRGGTLSFDSKATLQGNAYDSDTDLQLDKFNVAGSEGEALFKKTFGVPLTVALSLLRDLDGRISLGVPVSGGDSGGGVAIAPVVREALTRAIIGALSSPLKLLGAVRPGGDGELATVEPAPIAFKPGTAAMTKRSARQAEQLGAALAQLPSLRIRIAGRTGAKDVRAIGEAAVLQDLDGDRPVIGGVRNLFSGGTRSEVREALRARAAGEKAELAGEAAAKLDEWVARHPVEDEQLHRLATERAATLQLVLSEAGARSEQVLVDPVRPRRTKGRSEVDVDVVEDAVDDAGSE